MPHIFHRSRAEIHPKEKVLLKGLSRNSYTKLKSFSDLDQKCIGLPFGHELMKLFTPKNISRQWSALSWMPPLIKQIWCWQTVIQTMQCRVCAELCYPWNMSANQTLWHDHAWTEVHQTRYHHSTGLFLTPQVAQLAMVAGTVCRERSATKTCHRLVLIRVCER